MDIFDALSATGGIMGLTLSLGRALLPFFQQTMYMAMMVRKNLIFQKDNTAKKARRRSNEDSSVEESKRGLDSDYSSNDLTKNATDHVRDISTGYHLKYRLRHLFRFLLIGRCGQKASNTRRKLFL